jgi:hypothetical protein
VQATVVFAFFGLRALPAPATIVTYPDLASFLSAAGRVAFESFEETPLLDFEVHPSTLIGAFSLTSDGRFGVLTTGPTVGQHATTGTRYLAYNARTFTLSFTQPITALSLDFIDFGDLPVFLGQELTMTTSAGDYFLIKKTLADFDPPNGNEIYFGFTSNVPLTEVAFQTGVGDHMAIDSVRSAAMPEPVASLLGLWGAAWMVTRARAPRLKQ